MLDILIDTCEHLELIPLDKEKKTIKDYLWGITQNDTADEVEEDMGYLINNTYAPYCRLRDCPCVVLESPVLSQGMYGFGNFHQSMRMTLINREEITKCQDRKFSGGNPDGVELLEIFLLTHIKTD